MLGNRNSHGRSLCFYNHKYSTLLLRLYHAVRYFHHPKQLQRPSTVMQLSPGGRTFRFRWSFAATVGRSEEGAPQRNKAHRRPSPALSNTTSPSNFQKETSNSTMIALESAAIPQILSTLSRFLSPVTKTRYNVLTARKQHKEVYITNIKG